MDIPLKPHQYPIKIPLQNPLNPINSHENCHDIFHNTNQTIINHY